MKVLLIDVNCKNSSTGKIVYNIYNELNKQGHEVAICYGRGENIYEKNIFKFGIDIETYFHAMMTRITGLTGFFSPVSTRRLIRFIDDFEPDVVHIHELHAYFVNLYPLIEYLKFKRIKIVWTFHCEFMYTGKCGHANECEKWKTQCGKCPQLSDYPKSIFFDFTKLMFNQKKKMFSNLTNLTIVTPSRWLASRVKESFLENKLVEVIHNGIDMNIFQPRRFEHLKKRHSINNEKIILAVAPNLMTDSKGGNWVTQLASLMSKTEYKFILIGVDDLSACYADNVIILGRTTNQLELAEYYSMADVFVICSKKENFPTTCLEALACGTPVVGFDTGGTKETTPNFCGSFVEYGDVVALKNEVEKFAQSIENDTLRQFAVGYSVDNYDNLKMVSNYFKLYQN